MSTTDAQPLRGFAYVLSGVFLFACMDTTVKYLATRYPVPVVVGLRYLVHCLLMVLVLGPSQGRTLLRTQRTGMVLLRGACLAAASLFLTLALQRLPVAESTAILFFSPLLVVVMAGPILRERVGLLGWTAAVAGFAGILMIARPGGGLDGMGALFAGCAAIVTSVYQLLSRLLAATETTLALLFYTALVGMCAFAPAIPLFWEGASPPPLDWLLLCGVGVFGGVGHFLFTAAHRHTPASTLAPVLYAQVLWAALLGWLTFGHIPDAFAIAGMCTIAVAGALVAVRSRLASRALERAAGT